MFGFGRKKERLPYESATGIYTYAAELLDGARSRTLKGMNMVIGDVEDNISMHGGHYTETLVTGKERKWSAEASDMLIDTLYYLRDKRFTQLTPSKASRSNPNRPPEWSYKVVQMPETKYVGKHWRLEILHRGFKVESYKTSSRRDAEEMGSTILSYKKNPRRLRNPVQRAIPGLVVVTGKVNPRSTQRGVILFKPGVDPTNALLTDILGMVHYYPTSAYGQSDAEVNLGASQRGWGTLLYNIAARVARFEGAVALVPSDTRSKEAKEFWVRLAGKKERLAPLSDTEFVARFGSLADFTFANLTDDEFQAADRRAGEFFSFNYSQDQEIGTPSIRPNEYVETMNERLLRIRGGDKKNLVVLPPVTQGTMNGTYYLAEADPRKVLRATNIVASAAFTVDAFDGMLEITRTVGPGELVEILVDAIKFDADNNGIDRVYLADDPYGTRVLVHPLGLRGFKVAHGIDVAPMFKRGEPHRARSESLGIATYPGTWADRYLEEGLKRGTREQPLRLNRGLRTLKGKKR
jgi:hypothetical protein